MLIISLAVFLVLFALQEWLWRRTSAFLLYKGESRMRRGRSLAHLDSSLYAPEGHRWLTRYMLAYFATGISFLLAFFTLASWCAGRTA